MKTRTVHQSLETPTEIDRQDVYQKPVSDVNELKQHLTETGQQPTELH